MLLQLHLLASGVLGALVFVRVDLGELLQLALQDADVLLQLVGLAPPSLEGLWHLGSLGIGGVVRQIVISLRVIVLVTGWVGPIKGSVPVPGPWFGHYCGWL